MTWARYKTRLALWARVLGIAGCLAVGACSSEFAATVGASGSSGSAGVSSAAGSAGSLGSSGSAEAGAGGDAGQSDGGSGAGGLTSSGGNGGRPGASGAGGESAACGGRCTAKRPLCNLKTSLCVECLTKADCTDVSKPACDAQTHSCVECTDKSTCSGARPACDATKNACVECTTKTDCTNSAKPLCDTTAETCVACLQQSDCTSPPASACNAGSCAACTKDAECSNIPGKGVCNAGTCLQCTGAKFAACGSSMGTPLVCDSLQHTCTSNKQHSSGLCQTCVTDAQCSAGEICVLDKFASPSKDVGYFCHWKQGDTADGAPADCFSSGQPYVGVQKNATSIDGVTSDICSLAVSTCVANNQFRSTNCANPTSPDDSLCGVSPPKDAKCAQVGVSTNYRCTMTCGSDGDCPSPFTCNTGVAPRVCNLQ